MPKRNTTHTRDVTDVLRAIYDFGLGAAATDELREVIAWLSCEVDARDAPVKAHV